MLDSGSSNATSASGPPAYAKPYIVGDPKKGIPGILPQAAAQYAASGPSFFPGSTVAGFSPEQTQAMTMGANRAISGSPVNAAAGAETMKTLNGDYLSAGNPYLEAIRSRGARDASQIAGQFGAGGRTGSGAMQGSVAEGYTNAVAPYEYGTYNTERGAMANAAALAPQIANQDYVDINALGTIGQQRQTQAQQELQSEIDRWNFGQQIPQQKLQQYANLIYGQPGSTSYTQTPTAGTAQTLAGLGLSAASIAGQFGAFA